ncbi:MAG: hypothetical protein GOU99_00220 [Candidatus Altiarchaeota archaeon]|nr:hypothetical protein [Candidatus Altiarchaeota archaeon]
MAGCTEQADAGPIGSDDSGDKVIVPPSISGDLTVNFLGFPVSIQAGETETYELVVKNNMAEAVSGVKLYSFNFGSYLDSSCDGLKSIGSLLAGEERRISCRLSVLGSPVALIDQEVKWQLDYILSTRVGQLALEVHENQGTPLNSDSVSYSFSHPLFGFFELSSGKIYEGETARFSLSVDGTVEQMDSCNCDIQEIVIKAPKGFSLIGLSDWSYSNCELNNKCYTKTNINLPFDEEFTGSIAGVVKTETFYFPVILNGIGTKLEGSTNIEVS